MRFRDILLQIDSYPATTPHETIEAAIGFAKALDAGIAILALQVDIPLSRNFITEALVGLAGLEQEWEAASLAGCREALRRFELAATAAGVFAGAEIGRINLFKVDDTLVRRVRTRDLCLTSLAERFEEQVEWVRRAIFESGRPVLVMGGHPILSAGRIGDVAVAWDGTRSAARALADALPILERARAVRIVTFINEKEAARPGLAAEAARHLATHGVQAAIDEIDASGQRIGRAIDAYLEQRPADILVMGASGHAPVLDFVMGGATDHVLRNPPTALLLSH
uniref:UspA domain protein n=1 Tax=Caulobacter sp. (strain K31) TaxID=366602 RepID=B0SYH2_CAUSK